MENKLNLSPCPCGFDFGAHLIELRAHTPRKVNSIENGVKYFE